ncbi:hypothetical protein ACGFRG_13720 [Streptomyces sp. NPDC048696]|uniref:hypothetical protein n=1 Tax=Streptomyces sp. NPDC048696 TaxID=3365585 RepID=UPI003718456E
MTQSRQGDEPQLPAARPAHEGVVLPAEGSAPWPPAPQAAPPAGQSWGQPWGPDRPGQAPAPQGPPAQGPATVWAQPLPAETTDATQYIPPVPHADSGSEATQYLSPPPAGASEATQYIAPLPQADSGSEATQYIGAPPAGASDATQYIAPVPGPAGASDATRFIEPVPPAPGGAEATQFLAPVPAAPPGALPPEAPGGDGATQYLPPVPAASAAPPVPAPPQDAPYGIRPGAPGERQPPAEFDSLFRADGPQQPQRGGETQQLGRFGTSPSVQVQPQSQPPHFQAPPSAQQYQQQPPPGDAYAYDSYDDEPRRRSRLGVIAAVGVGLAVVGLGAGYLLSGGGGDDGKKDGNTPIAATTPTAGTDGGAKPGDDPAKAQAVELDKLLADSNNSRDAVIGAVSNIRSCDKLDVAASTLRDAAKQRGDLVTRLQKVAVDKLPNNAKLTAQLTKAWQASASADNHYAGWADQNGKGKGCKHGHSRHTAEEAQGDRASGEATIAKQQASGLWNAIAGKYGLTKRSSAQL